MTDEWKLRKDMDRAARAQVLLRDEMLTEAFDVLRAEYLQAWEETGALETVERERLHLGVIVLSKVRRHLERVVESGELAGHELSILLRTADWPGAS